MSFYLAFDLEIAKIIPEGTKDWIGLRPLGITCAATCTSGGNLTKFAATNVEGGYADRMSRTETSLLVDHLIEFANSGGTILTWNGLGFDFDILAEESGRQADCAALARDHVDMMFHIFCLRGHGLSLEKAAQGMGVPGKLPGMTGDLVPLFWQEGKQALVLDYVSQDVRTTLAVAQAVEIRRALRWISASGSEQFLRMPSGWLTVKNALQLPLPITTRLKNPWTRSKFTAWLERSASE